MYSVLDFCQDKKVLRFTFSTPGLEEHEWHHTALAEPIVGWYNDILVPLVNQHGESLTAEDVVQAVSRSAAQQLIQLTSVDWLGLALLAAQICREFAARLATNDTLESQQMYLQRATLGRVLAKISENVASAVQSKLSIAA
jgi:hypothetical protein